MDNTSMISVINTLIKRKRETGQDQKETYNSIELSTEDCNTSDDMYVKYNNEIENSYQTRYEKITRLMLDVNTQLSVDDLTENEKRLALYLRKAKYMFNLDRREYNSEDEIEEDKYSIILEKSNELSEIVRDINNINFENSKEVFMWVQKMVPYINIQSVTVPNIATPIDVYLLETLKSKGYTTEKTAVNNEQDFYRNMLANQLKELSEYHFFVSDYDLSVRENEELTSIKTKRIAQYNLNTDLDNEYTRRLRHTNRQQSKLEKVKQEIEEESEKLRKTTEENIKVNKHKLEDLSNITVTSKVFKTECNEAKEAYEKTKLNPTYSNINDMFNKIGRIHDEEYKNKLVILAYKLLDEQRDNKKITDNDYKTIIKVNEYSNIKRKDSKIYEERLEELEDRLEDIKINFKEAISELLGQMKKLIAEQGRIKKIISNVKRDKKKAEEELNSMGYVPKDIEPQEEKEEEEEKENAFDKIKNIFKKKNKEQDVLVIMDENEETLFEVVPIKKINKIKENLYNKINNPKVKKKISKGLNKISDKIKEVRDNVKENAAKVEFICATVILVGIALIGASNDKKNEETQDISNSIVVPIETPIEIQEEEVSSLPTISELADEALEKVLTGENTVYTSVGKASSDIDGVDPDRLIKDKWENAEVKDYYKREDNKSIKISEEEAQALYDAGENVIISAENDDTIIGYTNIRK